MLRVVAWVLAFFVGCAAVQAAPVELVIATVNNGHILPWHCADQ